MARRKLSLSSWHTIAAVGKQLIKATASLQVAAANHVSRFPIKNGFECSYMNREMQAIPMRLSDRVIWNYIARRRPGRIEAVFGIDCRIMKYDIER